MAQRQNTTAPPPERKPVEAWAQQKSPEAWVFAAARALHGWAIGQELTEAQFDAACHAAAHVPIGYPNRFEVA